MLHETSNTYVLSTLQALLSNNLLYWIFTGKTMPRCGTRRVKKSPLRTSLRASRADSDDPEPLHPAPERVARLFKIMGRPGLIAIGYFEGLFNHAVSHIFHRYARVRDHEPFQPDW